MPWLDDFLDAHSELETPKSFWLWSALVSISAIVKDNVWIDRHIHNLYPNIYVMLHADSGLKKGPAISAAKRLVSLVGGTRIISGRSSIQGILKELGTAQTQPGGKVINKSTAFICSSELTSSIVDDKVATDILTDLFDRQYNIGEWRSLLKAEQFNLKDPTITMFTATNDAHSQEFFGRKDIQGGYFARTFIISEHVRNRSNSLLVPLTNPPNYQKMAEYLKEVAKLVGAFEPLAATQECNGYEIPYMGIDATEASYYTEAGVIYQKWYDELSERISNKDVKDDTGTLNRFGDSVLKVAMLLSLARSPELTIDAGSMQLAIDYCERLIGNVRELTLGKRGLSEAKSLKALIIAELFNRSNHQISRTMLMKQMWSHFRDANEIDEIMMSFDQSGIIQVERMGDQIVYRMPEKQVLEYQKMFARRGNR